MPSDQNSHFEKISSGYILIHMLIAGTAENGGHLYIGYSLCFSTLHIFILEPPYFLCRGVFILYIGLFVKITRGYPHTCCFPLKPREQRLIFAVDCFGVPICCANWLRTDYKNRWIYWLALPIGSSELLNSESSQDFIYAKISLWSKKKKNPQFALFSVFSPLLTLDFHSRHDSRILMCERMNETPGQQEQCPILVPRT